MGKVFEAVQDETSVIGPGWDMMPDEGIVFREEPVGAEAVAMPSNVEHSRFVGRASLYDNREWTLQYAETAAYRGGIGF